MFFYFDDSITNKRSVAIKDVYYDAWDSKLLIRFNNGNGAEYLNVNADLFQRMKRTDSLGRFYNRYIKTRHRIGKAGVEPFTPERRAQPVFRELEKHFSLNSQDAVQESTDNASPIRRHRVTFVVGDVERHHETYATGVTEAVDTVVNFAENLGLIATVKEVTVYFG